MIRLKRNKLSLTLLNGEERQQHGNLMVDGPFNNEPLAEGCKVGGVPKRTDHGNRPIFSTKFRKTVHILAFIGKRNTGGHGNSYFDRCLTDF